MFIRHQAIPYLTDLSVEFMECFCDLWGEQGLPAARCFAIGA